MKLYCGPLSMFGDVRKQSSLTAIRIAPMLMHANRRVRIERG